MDYQSRMLEYLGMLHELEIGGEEHLKVILKDPSAYLKRAEETQRAISSDNFLLGEDKERMLKKISGYLERVNQSEKKDDSDLNYILSFLAGALLVHMLRGDKSQFTADAIDAFKDELGKILTSERGEV